MAEEPVIENEFPAYRAISAMAVTSLLFGVLSILCFADSWFLVAAVAAIVTGALATRKIQRLPDVLTGRALAQAGIGMGLVFGLASITTEAVQGFIRSREALKFANEYVGALRGGGLAKAIWYRIPPAGRKETTPEQALEEMTKGNRDASMFEMQTAQMQTLVKRLDSSAEETFSVVEVERHGLEGLDPYALVLLRLAGPGDKEKEIPPHDDYALVIIKGKINGKVYEWRVDDLIYPYKPKTHVVKAKPVDDGHGHGGH
jgi:hypothetical protein